MLPKLLRPRTDLAYFLLRVVAGLLFSFHGMQKILGVLPHEQQPPIEFGSQLWLGGMIELVCGLMIAFGVLTSWAAFLASGTMAVAYIQFHWKGQLGAQFFPAVNGGEPALLYSFLFLYIACRGGGKWSFESRETKVVER
ncbi:MAG TPA: DoxX family protein [Planctomycetota bacterium]|nr:DoxX family protein [Planctomycetota bacterium]